MLGRSGRLFLSLHDDSCQANKGKLNVQVTTSKIGGWSGGSYFERTATQINGAAPVTLPNGQNMQQFVLLNFGVSSSILSIMVYSEAQQGPDPSRRSVSVYCVLS